MSAPTYHRWQQLYGGMRPREIKALKQKLQRKEKALAEMTALLGLRKK